MCIVCSDFESMNHWSNVEWVWDREAQIGAFHENLKLIRSISQNYRVSVSYGLGTNFLSIRNETGADLVVESIDGLWPGIESLINCHIDPLSEELLTRLEEGTE